MRCMRTDTRGTGPHAIGAICVSTRRSQSARRLATLRAAAAAALPAASFSQTLLELPGNGSKAWA